MELESIGRNIRKFRIAKKLRQEDLAERTGLSTNYIGALERCEKIPSLETFIGIINALNVTSDMVLSDVLNTGYAIKDSMLGDRLAKLSEEDRARIYDVMEALLRHSASAKH